MYSGVVGSKVVTNSVVVSGSVEVIVVGSKVVTNSVVVSGSVEVIGIFGCILGWCDHMQVLI